MFIDTLVEFTCPRGQSSFGDSIPSAFATENARRNLLLIPREVVELQSVSPLLPYEVPMLD